MKTAWQLGQESVAKGIKFISEDKRMMILWNNADPSGKSILENAWFLGRESVLSNKGGK